MVTRALQGAVQTLLGQSSNSPPMADNSNTIAKIKACIGSHPDFPKKGIIFRDIFPVLRNPSIAESLFSALAEHYRKTVPDLQAIVGIEARGFLLGMPLALQLGVPFVPIRKAGKLPGNVVKTTYELEYGTDTVEIQSDAIQEGEKVVIIDDLLATGGTMKSAVRLVQMAGGKVAECTVVIELMELKGRKDLAAPFFSLIQF